MERLYEKEANVFCDAIRAMADKPETVDNLESYLSNHFDVWLKCFADTPDRLANELKEFAKISCQ